MKQLLAGIVLIIVVGVLGFLYRYEIENPKHSGTNAVPSGVACTDEAKICPDGSAVGRTGPSCAFATCPPPNAELVTGSTTIDFVLPAGYKRNVVASDDSSYLASYIQEQGASASSTDSASVINIHSYVIPTGSSASKVMLAETYFDPSGLQATSTAQFKSVTEGKNTFYEIQIGRFEGQIETAYYLYEPGSVLSFSVIERGVQNWMDSNLNPNVLPQHVALQQMLATLQVSQ